MRSTRLGVLRIALVLAILAAFTQLAGASTAAVEQAFYEEVADMAPPVEVVSFDVSFVNANEFTFTSAIEPDSRCEVPCDLSLARTRSALQRERMDFL